MALCLPADIAIRREFSSYSKKRSALQTATCTSGRAAFQYCRERDAALFAFPALGYHPVSDFPSSSSCKTATIWGQPPFFSEDCEKWRQSPAVLQLLLVSLRPPTAFRSSSSPCLTKKFKSIGTITASAAKNARQANKHKGCVIWFTGLSACGKSTVANLVDHKLHPRGVKSFVLDGDNVRHGLNAAPAMLKERHGEEFAKRFGLGFSAQDREENIRRIGAVAELFCASGTVALTAFISPYRRDRDAVRARLKPGDFIEVFVDAPLEVCEKRDPKGLYKKARAGELKGFTGHRRSLRSSAEAGIGARRRQRKRPRHWPTKWSRIWQKSGKIG